MSLQQGEITTAIANELADQYGPEYLRELLRVSQSKPQSHSRLSSKEETAILIVLGQREKLAEVERQKARAEEFDRQQSRHVEILDEAKKAREVTERSAASAQTSAVAAEKSAVAAEAAVREAERSATATENQVRIAVTAVGVSENATKAAQATADIAKKQFWLSASSLVVSIIAIVVSILALRGKA